MSKTPTGLSIYAFPENGGKPTVIWSNAISSETIKLAAGVYNILVFNQIPSDFGTVSFRGLNSWETAAVYSNNETKAQWAISRAESQVVRQPEIVAAATYTGIEISKKCIEESIEEYKHTGKRILAHTLNLKPKIVVKKTFVRVKVEGIHNLRSTRAVFTGMSIGYNFSTQQSIRESVSHVMEKWKINPFEYGDRLGETNGYFLSFGLPSTTTATRVIPNWRGSIDLQMLLVDNKTIINHKADITTYTTTVDNDSKADAGNNNDIEIETSVVVKIGLSSDPNDKWVVLPDVKPEGGSSSGFDATVEDWGDEESVELPT